LRDQFAELRIMIDCNDPAHVEAETAFAAMVTEITRQAEIGRRRGFARVKPPMRRKRQIVEPLATRLMLGTAEAYDALGDDRLGAEPARDAVLNFVGGIKVSTAV
jgi:hypothetical protein